MLAVITVNAVYNFFVSLSFLERINGYHTVDLKLALENLSVGSWPCITADCQAGGICLGLPSNCAISIINYESQKCSYV